MFDFNLNTFQFVNAGIKPRWEYPNTQPYILALMMTDLNKANLHSLVSEYESDKMEELLLKEQMIRAAFSLKGIEKLKRVIFLTENHSVNEAIISVHGVIDNGYGCSLEMKVEDYTENPVCEEIVFKNIYLEVKADIDSVLFYFIDTFLNASKKLKMETYNNLFNI